jgi:dTDP-4-dehydrorhamnose 3,5-epimerase
MELIKTPLNDAVIVEPKVFGDERGFFLETWNKQTFSDLGLTMDFVQDNHSKSSKGILRGLHYQLAKTQGKLVRVISGEVFDVAVDLRQGSSSFGQWHGVLLSEQNKKMFWVPPGFAHGFYVTSDSAEFLYKCTDYYDPASEVCLRWDDPELGIDWPLEGGEPQLSAKDLGGVSFEEASKFS